MICFPCGRGVHEDCANLFNSLGKRRAKGEETTTWCDCMHRTGVILQSSQCQHINTNGADTCPTCGKDMLEGKSFEIPSKSGDGTGTNVSRETSTTGVVSDTKGKNRPPKPKSSAAKGK
jgi:hypothetical protein